MIIEEIKNIDSSPRELRKFALAMAVPLALIGGFLLWRGREYYWYFFIASGLFIFPGLVVPFVLTPLHKLLGKDLLDMKFEKDSSQSYWLARNDDDLENRDYRKQF